MQTELDAQQARALQVASNLLAATPYQGVSTRDISDALEIPIEAVKPILMALIAGEHVMVSGAGVIVRVTPEQAQKAVRGKWAKSVAVQAGPHRYHISCACQAFTSTTIKCLGVLETTMGLKVAKLVELFGLQRVQAYWPQDSTGAFLEMVTQAQWDEEEYAHQRRGEDFNNQCAHCYQDIPFNPF